MLTRKDASYSPETGTAGGSGIGQCVHTACEPISRNVVCNHYFLPCAIMANFL